MGDCHNSWTENPVLNQPKIWGVNFVFDLFFQLRLSQLETAIEKAKMQEPQKPVPLAVCSLYCTCRACAVDALAIKNRVCQNDAIHQLSVRAVWQAARRWRQKNAALAQNSILLPQLNKMSPAYWKINQLMQNIAKHIFSLWHCGLNWRPFLVILADGRVDVGWVWPVGMDFDIVCPFESILFKQGLIQSG